MRIPRLFIAMPTVALLLTGCASTGPEVSPDQSSATSAVAVVSGPADAVFGLPDTGDVTLIGGGLGSFRFAEPGTVFLVDGHTRSSVWSIPVESDDTIAIADEIDSEALFGAVLMGRYGLQGAAFFAAAQAASMGEEVPADVKLPSDPIRFLVYFQPEAPADTKSGKPTHNKAEAAE